MKPEEIREIADREATATSPNNRIRARLYAGTLNRQITEALRILEQAGYVVVPKEPTEEMCREGAAKVRDYLTENGPYPRTRAMYRAMLAALTQETKA